MTENPFELPLDIAAIVLTLAADVIQHAATAAGGKWGLTDYTPDIRINVGFTEILTTQEEQLRLILDRQLVDLRMLPRAVVVTPRRGGKPYYPSIPHSVLIEVPYRPIKDLVRTIQQVRPSLYAAIVSAGRRGVGRGVRRGHSSDMVRELGRFLNRDLPQPGYPIIATASAPALPDPISDPDLMEGALHRASITSPYGAGFGDPEQNRKVEQAAVRIVSKWYRKEGWQVVSVEARHCGFDLLCERDGTELHVEVKGAAGSERRFIVTAGELRHATDDDRFVLALVTDALSKHPKLEHWAAPSFRNEFDFEPIQYWATATAKKATASKHGMQPTRKKDARG